MDLRNQEDETPAADEGSCLTCWLAARVAAVATTILVLGLLLGFVLFVTQTGAPESDQASKASGEQLVMMEQLLRCQQERHEVKLMLQTVTGDSRCSMCPDGWIWWRRHCYFFSVGLQEDRRWNGSVAFCLQHNSSLAVIKDSAEMEFIQSVMMKFPHFPFLWVGLTDAEQEGQWLWGDGTDVQHYMPITVEWDDDHRDCADLRGGGSLFAARCEAYGPWVCKRDY